MIQADVIYADVTHAEATNARVTDAETSCMSDLYRNDHCQLMHEGKSHVPNARKIPMAAHTINV